MLKLSPHSRPNKLQLLDGRSAEAREIARFKADMAEHCGGHPSATQRALIDRAAILHLRLLLMDRRSLSDLNEASFRRYAEFSNSLTDILKQLGASPHRIASGAEAGAVA